MLPGVRHPVNPSPRRKPCKPGGTTGIVGAVCLPRDLPGPTVLAAQTWRAFCHSTGSRRSARRVRSPRPFFRPLSSCTHAHRERALGALAECDSPARSHNNGPRAQFPHAARRAPTEGLAITERRRRAEP
jgi:hypothetical protein